MIWFWTILPCCDPDFDKKNLYKFADKAGLSYKRPAFRDTSSQKLLHPCCCVNMLMLHPQCDEVFGMAYITVSMPLTSNHQFLPSPFSKHA